MDWELKAVFESSQMTLNKRMDEFRELLNVTKMQKKDKYYMQVSNESSGELIKFKYHLYAFHIVRSKIVV